MTTPAQALPATDQQVDKIYQLGYIKKAEKLSPHGFEALKKLTIIVTAIAIGTLLAFPLAAAIAAATSLSFSASVLVSVPTLSFVLSLVLNEVNKCKHWFDIRAASLILEQKDRSLLSKWMNKYYPYHSKPEPTPPEAPSTTPAQAVTSTFSHYTTNPDQHALIMGLDYPKTQDELQNCRNDAEHIKDILLNAGFNKKNITMMRDDPGTESSDTYPTSEHIIAQMKAKIAAYNAALAKNPEAILYFHYSGHGARVKDTGVKDEKDGKDEAIVPTDFKYITDDQLKDILKLVSEWGNMIATMDCCHSGTIYDLKNNYQFVKGEVQAEEPGGDPGLGNIVMISGCLDPQYSSDGGTIKGKGAGAMTAAYWTTLEEYDYTLTWRQLLEGMNAKVKEAGITDQNPQLSSSRPLDLDSYVMTREIRFYPGSHIAITA